jgi:hypothetical protein
MKIIQALFFYVFCISIISCAGTPPKDEYVLSFTALENAKRAQADKFEPKLSYQSKKLYEKALNFYEERNYSKAKEYFIKSRFLAEKAEVRARVKKFKNGEVVL